MQHQEHRRGELTVSTDPARLDVDAIHRYLSEESYWATGIPRGIVERSIAGSLCFGVYFRARQVGFARVVTDAATYAYLCDVFVLESHRGRGLGKWLMECIMIHPALQDLRRVTLATRGAHGLYAQFGFTPLAEPSVYMHIVRPNAYAQPLGSAP
jgi:GNAT superfamily N-acetyltransferase